MITPCTHCPWRVANHGKRTPWGFYTKANLRRLWNQVRGGGKMQSCHPTDPGHPDHIAAGAKAGATPQECAGSVMLVYREMEKLQACGDGVIDNTAIGVYLKRHRDGLTKSGMLYWVVSRYSMGGVPYVGGPKLPDVPDIHDPAIGRLA